MVRGQIPASFCLAQHEPHSIWKFLIGTCAGAVAYLFHNHFIRRSEIFTNRRDYRRAGRRRKLARDVARIERNSREQLCNGRRRYRKLPMLHLNEPASDMDLRTSEVLNREQFEPDAGSDDVNDRVHRTDLMEVYLPNVDAVNFRLGRSKSAKDRFRSLLDTLGYC